MDHRTSTSLRPHGLASRTDCSAWAPDPARRALAAALLAVAAGAVGAAGPPLPQRNLAVEARVVESSALDRQTLAGGSTVVVGTGGSTQPAGSVRAGTDSHRNDSVQRVLVLNGGRATVRLSQWLPLRSAEWVWAGRGSGAGSSTVWVDIGQGLTVRPAWPGGNQPVRAEVAVESTARDDTRGAFDRQRPAGADASLPRLSVSTELALPLGEWVTVAQLFDDSDGTARGSVAGGSGGGVVSSTRTLRREQTVQLRITAP